MSEKHTPGPWERDEIDPWPAVVQTAYVHGTQGQLTIATCGAQGAETEANARLIAAAPELLAALKGLVGFYEVRYAHDSGPAGEGWQSDELMALWASAEAAIAKAEGGSPND